MKIQQFLEHHGIVRNPFAEEDAQSDPVFKEHCIRDTYHPAWDKIYGEPSEPATSIVFGEKGAGKTALRLQIDQHLQEYTRTHVGKRPFVIHYDDFNPFLDRFVSRLPARRRRIDRALSQWRLWDHMDAMLSLGVTELVNRVLGSSRNGTGAAPSVADLDRLDRHQRRDFLVLAACYDQSLEQPYLQRWHKLRRQLRFWALRARLPLVVGIAVTVVVLLGAAGLLLAGSHETLQRIRQSLPIWVYPLLIGLGWLPWLGKVAHRWFLAWGVSRGLRVVLRPVNALRSTLMGFTSGELSGQPLPNRDRTDDRYELLTKFQSILQSLGHQGVFVLVDRADEPYLINGSADLMRALIWPMLDNKLLKHPGIGIKMMLPAELKYFVEREGRDFSQRAARLDKQNMVPSLAWTGEALFDVANARLRACASEGQTTNVQDFFDESVTHQRLLDGFRLLRVPRHLHKFLYQLLVSHCNAHTDENPQWKISKERFESELALYERNMAENRI